MDRSRIIAHQLSMGLLAGSILVGLCFTIPAAGQDAASSPGDQSKPTLNLRQRQISQAFDELEQLMLKMADIDESGNPDRANLLRDAVRQSKEQLVKARMSETANILEGGQLKRASDQQTTIETDLRNLLRLLQSENRDEQLKSEEARLREYIKETQKLLNRQRSIQGRTESNNDPKRLAEQQRELGEDSGDLAKEIAREHEGISDSEVQEGEPGDADPMDGAPSEKESAGDESQSGEPDEGQPMPGESTDGKPMDGEPKDNDALEGKPMSGEPSEGKPMEGDSEPSDPAESDPKAGEAQAGESSEGDPMPGEPMSGEPMEGESSDGEPMSGDPMQGNPMGGEPQQGEPQSGDRPQQQPPQSDEFSPRKRIEEAQRRMKQAEKKLEEADKEGATKEQDAAKDELAQAIAELEQILRQLREEEIERVLARLEARFTKMLEMQLRVNDDTERLAKVSEDQRGSSEDIQAGKLSFAEKQIVVEADKTLELLREEGSSIAFPEAMDQIREDMVQVTELLAQTKVDALTQTIQADIVAALEELLEAIKQAQEEQEDRREQDPQQQQQQQMQPGDESLVNQIQELKLIKSMQIRVNKRTDGYAKLLEDADDAVGQATSEDLIRLLRDLAERQNRIYQITRDNVLGKNK
ncbi:MAG: hypothetical protein WDZ51_01420 [Pirellulaceae bacterium]